MNNATILFVCLLAGTVASDAEIVFADDFSYGDGTTLSGQTPDVGGQWSGGGGWQVNGGAVSLVGGSDTVFGNFTSALSAGQKLTITFATQAVTGFLGPSWAVLSLYAADTESAFIGDPGDPTTYWSMGGPIANVTTADSNQANTATFTYEYDSGAWTFSTNGGAYNGIGTAGFAINRIRIGSGGTSDASPGNMKVDAITVSIEQIAAAELEITAFTQVDASTYQIAWSGGDGVNDVEASADLVEWEPILEDVVSPQDITVDTETNPKHFYRVVEPAP